MAEKFVIYGYNFHPEIRKWTTKVCNSRTEAFKTLKRIWKDYQDKYVIEWAKADYDDYKDFNRYEEHGDTAYATSREYDCDNSYILQAEAIHDGEFAAFVALDNEVEQGVSLLKSGSRADVMAKVLESMAWTAIYEDSPCLECNDDDTFHLYDSISFDENEYKIIQL